MGKVAAEGVKLDLAGESGGVEDELDGHRGGALLPVEWVGLGYVLEGGQQLLLVLHKFVGLGNWVFKGLESTLGSSCWMGLLWGVREMGSLWGAWTKGLLF